MKILGENVLESTNVSGGCISNCQKLTTESGKRYFIKNYQKNGIAEAEAIGLAELTKAEIKVPHVYEQSKNQLILDFIESSSSNAKTEKLAESLAKVHGVCAEQFGFDSNNFIGSTLQINNKQSDWLHFFWEHRILFQLRLAEQNGCTTNELLKSIAKLENRIESILSGTDESPALLHGDLWSGNYFYDRNGEPVLVDPAVYYGHREADIAMTTLFGGFPEQFYKVYNEISPLKDDWQQRLKFYNIYHLLNHLNLFGSSYYSQLISTIQYYI